MAKAFAVVTMSGGLPVLTDTTGHQLPYNAMALAAHLPDYSYGIYLFSGTAAELTAIQALPTVWRICTTAELDDVITSTRRTALNGWLTARGFPTIPAGETYRQVLRAIVQRLNAGWTEDRVEARE